jgi:hypothetical protein
MSGVRLLVGTQKCAFVLTSDGTRQRWKLGSPHFVGWEIYHLKGSIADPNRLYASLDGDLNSITMKALEKVRGRRYASVAELTADIQRYIEHRPVLASPPGALYRARKFLRRHRPAVFGAAAGLAFVALGGVTEWWFVRGDSPPSAKLTDKDTIVLADFDNKTGDPVFDDTLRQGLSVELQQSPFLSLLSDARIGQTLPLMGQPKDVRLTPEIAQQICERTRSAAILEGSITSLGSQYVLGLQPGGKTSLILSVRSPVNSAPGLANRWFRWRGNRHLSPTLQHRHSKPSRRIAPA